MLAAAAKKEKKKTVRVSMNQEGVRVEIVVFAPFE